MFFKNFLKTKNELKNVFLENFYENVFKLAFLIEFLTTAKNNLLKIFNKLMHILKTFGQRCTGHLILMVLELFFPPDEPPFFLVVFIKFTFNLFYYLF